jgi:two-component system sensor histidine kinase KdpD
VLQAASGGSVLSPGVTTTVIEELVEALERERSRARKLEEANEALVERVARRHELVSRLGHELRTPVTVILGVARTLASPQVGETERADLLDALMNKARALARLIERFELAADAGALEVVDLEALTRDVAGDDPRVGVDVRAGSPEAALNPVLARRILEELLDNARRFSPEGTPVVVRIERHYDEILLRVSDAGDGVAEADRERIFEPLEQVEPLDARTHQGAGVGLPLARAAARAMDGDLELESTSPAGSVFLWTVRARPQPRA